MAGKTESPPQKSSKKNEQLNEAFVLTFQEQVETAILEKQTTLPRVRLFCQDESRLGLLPVVQRRITSCGVKPVAAVNSQYDWFYLYGAVEPLTGDGFFLELPRLTGECFQIVRNIPNKRMPKKNSPTNVAGETDVTMHEENIVVCQC